MGAEVSQRVAQVWGVLSTSPLVWVTLTLGSYSIAVRLFQRLKGFPLAHPLILSVAIIITVLLLTHTPYDTYSSATQLIQSLLGPATVALAIPLYLHVERVKQLLLPLAVALVVGSLTAMISAVAIAAMFGASEEILRSLVPKSVTTPIALVLSEQVGGIPSLTTVFVIITGIVGALGGKAIFDLLRIQHPGARGFALGLAAHGLGTARALQFDIETGAFAGLAIGLNGVVTSVLAPILVQWIWPR